MDEEGKLITTGAEVEEVPDDSGSNNSAGSTASHISEEFVKVNEDDATVEDAGTGKPRHDDVENVAPAQVEAETGGKLLDRLDPRAGESMASENYLRDYYDQLPSETAAYPSEESGEMDEAMQYEHGDASSVLQPEVVTPQDPFQTSAAQGSESLFEDRGMQLGGGHSMFEPAPAASFEPELPRSISPITPTPQPPFTKTECLTEDTLEKEPEIDIQVIPPDSYNTEVGSMSSEQPEHQGDAESPEGEQVFKPEVEPQTIVEPEFQHDDNLVKEEPPAESITTMPEPKEEVQDLPVPVVEDIDTKTEPVPTISQCPAAAGEQKAVDEVEDQDPVVDLMYWRDIKKTAFVFSFLLLILGSLTVFSIISVVAYTGLALLTVTVAFRLYKLVLQTLNGTQQPHPFQALLDADVTLSPERAQKYTSAVLGHVNCCLTSARNLFLVQNTISSLKLGVFLWLMTYIGCCFNGLTLLIIDVVLSFTVPPIYEKYQTQIDTYYEMARDKVFALIATAKAKMPGAKQAKEKAQ